MPRPTEFTVYWCPICEIVTRDSWHSLHDGGLFPQLATEHECETIIVVPKSKEARGDVELAQAFLNATEPIEKERTETNSDAETVRAALRWLLTEEDDWSDEECLRHGEAASVALDRLVDELRGFKRFYLEAEMHVTELLNALTEIKEQAEAAVKGEAIRFSVCARIAIIARTVLELEKKDPDPKTGV